jgi:hypothetical protein
MFKIGQLIPGPVIFNRGDRHGGTMLPKERLEPSCLRRSQCAAHTASEFRGSRSFQVWRVRFLRVSGERIRGPRLLNAKPVSRLIADGRERMRAASMSEPIGIPSLGSCKSTLKSNAIRPPAKIGRHCSRLIRLTNDATVHSFNPQSC